MHKDCINELTPSRCARNAGARSAGKPLLFNSNRDFIAAVLRYSDRVPGRDAHISWFSRWSTVGSFLDLAFLTPLGRVVFRVFSSFRIYGALLVAVLDPH